MQQAVVEPGPLHLDPLGEDEGALELPRGDAAVQEDAPFRIVPLAAAWGVGQAAVSDYLGPNRVRLAADYSGEIQVDLGPLGRAYLASPYAPVGVEVTVGGA